MNLKNPAILAAGAFLAAWSATNFDADYRAILWSILSGVFGYVRDERGRTHFAYQKTSEA